ncbi:MAG TPA: LysR family transcriptional regulator [Xanthobacteraceae bacterium]|jgi:LysR family nitrogen assimilation transcriptional regulator|nr:LysR family transcriptional regulator [Xanthobacteraceae bacterium]
MDARALRYFVQVSDSRSFSKAANFLRIGQPALSRSIQQLEQELGCQLFVRTRRGVELTSAGQILRARSKVILDQFAQLRDEVRAHAYEVAGTASVGVPSAGGQIIVPELMRELAEHYAGIRLHIVEGLSAETYDRLLGRTVDIGLLYDPSAHRELASEPVAIENMFLVGRREDVAALGPIQDLAQLENLPFILPKSPNSRRLLVEKAFRERSLMLNVAAEIDGFATTHALLREGAGFSIMTHAALEGQGRDASLVAVELAFGGLQWRLDLVRHRSQLNNPVVNVVAEVIRRVVARLIAQGRWKGAARVAASQQATPLEETARSAGATRKIRYPSARGRRNERQRNGRERSHKTTRMASPSTPSGNTST